MEAVLSAAAKLAGINQYDGLPDLYAAAPFQQKQQQQHQRELHASGVFGTESGFLELDGALEAPESSRIKGQSQGGPAGGHQSDQGGQLLEELMLCTLESLRSQGLKARPHSMRWILIYVSTATKTNLDATAYSTWTCAFSAYVRCAAQRLRAHVCSQLMRVYIQLGEWAKVAH